MSSPANENSVLSKKKLKRKAFKEMKKAIKQQILQENLNTPGENTIKEEELKETIYVIERGLRRVVPYAFTFNVYAKERWLKKTIVEFFVREFRGHSIDYYINAILQGHIQINRTIPQLDQIMVAHDLISHRIHRHEPVIAYRPIKIIHCDNKKVVINKPASIPIHPTGRYRHNTVLFILAHEMGLCNLYPIHRLDRLTSGLVIFARSSALANVYAEKIRRSGSVQKTYLARVVGEFPEEPFLVDQPILISIDVGSRQLNRVDPKGKICQTRFQRIFYNNGESVICCQPITGRTHQIRVHLQWLGYPIINDPLYNESFRNKYCEKWQLNMEELEKEDLLVNIDETLPMDSDELLKEINKRIEYYKSKNYNSLDQVDIDTIDPIPFCADCKIKYRDPWEYETEIYLHAWKYSGSDFDFETEKPVWANEDFVSPKFEKTNLQSQ